jgi:putative redox protein
MAEPSVTASIGAADFQVQLSDGTHAWIADEPVKLGGADTGPNPDNLLLSSLGACTSITMKMYAKHKGWPLETVHVALALERSDDSTTIDRQIVVSGPLSDEQRERLLQIANKCPVHKILSGTIQIHSGLTPA